MLGRFFPVNKGFTKYACLLAALCLTSPAWANLVQNSNFGTGSFADWTVNGLANHPWTIETAGFDGLEPYPGDTYFASTGCVGANCITGTAAQQASLAQTLATTLGDTYTLTFQFYTGGNGIDNELDVLWDGVSVKDLGPDGTLGAVPAYTLYTVTGLVGTGSDTLTFLGRQDPGYDALDNVDVEVSGTTGAVPEPSSISFAVAGLFGILLAGRRHAKKSA